MKQDFRARGGQNGVCPVFNTGGVWPKGVEASFCLDFLDTFSSREKYQNLMAAGKKTNYNVILWSVISSYQKR